MRLLQEEYWPYLGKSMKVLTTLVVLMLICGCAPEVGTKEWCEDIDKKSKGDWSANDAKAYAEHCIFNTYKDAKD